MDGPEEGTALDVVPASRGETFLCWVEAADGDRIVVSAPRDRALRPVPADVGERVDLVWRGQAELHSLPCELVSVEPSGQPRWVLRPGGVIQRGQRRDAVRAPLSVPVGLGPDSDRASGTTVDVSEGGLRCVLDKGAATDWLRAAAEQERWAGSVVLVALRLPDLPIRCLGEITRRFPRDDGRIELSVRFIGLPEHDQDELRRRVFDRLRDLRRRGLL